jgi:hypothetical protein
MPYRTAQIDPPDATLKGIEQTLKEEGEVDIVLIHGMGPHDATTFAAEIGSLAQKLGRTFDANAYVAAPGIPLPHGGSLLVASLGGTGGKINTFAILWSPVDLQWKQTLCYDVSVEVKTVCDDPTAFTKDIRATFNGYLKSVLLDGALSDVVYYISPEGNRRLYQTVRKAILIALAGGIQSATEDEAFKRMEERVSVPLFEMSESLGSKILRDTLIRMTSEDGASARAAAHQQALVKAVGRNRALFMAANQIPVLSVTSTPELTAHFESGTWQERYPAKASSELHKFAAMVQEGKRISGRRDVNVPLKVVAFSDPSDLLTYSLRPYFKDNPTELLEVIDVRVSNDWTYVGAIENPWPAHTSYWQTDSVVRVLKCGVGADAQACN